jgi:tricorn protease
VKMMLGELNASHVGVSPPRHFENPDDTGSLGVLFDPKHEGPGLRIASVLRGSPGDREESRLEAGDVLLSIGGVPLDKTVNVHRLLNHAANRKVLLEVASAKEPGEKREVVIRPFSLRRESRARYEAYVRENRRLASEWSGGRLAYVHIRGMGWSSFERFERELYSVAHGREGLIIDVRNNGGGWTTDMLFTILSVRPHAWTRSRGGGKGYPQGRRPFYGWSKPATALCNEASFSNAEIFSHAFKTLKRGPLVGFPTYGGVISTGSRRLLDGSWIRMPTRGWWVHPDGPDMELNGAVPDHIVPFTPEDEEAGRDPQLKKAVEVLLAQLEEGK